MPVQLSPKRQVKGLYSNFNHSSGIPEGGLLEASNCVSDRPGLISKRKGFNRYGDVLSQPPDSLIDYNGSLVVHNGTNISCDSEGTGSFTSWGDIYEGPGGAHKIRGDGVKNNFYFTSSAGVYRNDSLTGTPSLSGMPEGLDIDLTKVGTGDGWFSSDSQVSYRIVWSREDANKSIIIGEPTQRHIAKNPKATVSITHDGADKAIVTHTAHGFSHGDLVAISDASVSDLGASYNGEGKTITALSDDSYSFEFSTDLGTTLASAGKRYSIDLKFTVPEGIVSGDKYQIYRTEVSAGGTVDPGTEHFNVVKKVVTADQLTEGTVEFSDTTLEISLDGHLYTNSSQETDSQSNHRPPQCKDISEYRGHLFFADLSYRPEREIHLSEIEDIVSGDSISIKVGAETLTYKFFTEEALVNREFLLDTTGSTTEEKIQLTAQSLVRIINRDPDNSLIYAHYVSGVADAAGKVLIRIRDVRYGSFSVTASSAAVGASFKEEIPTTGETFAPEDNAVPNGLAYSKLLEPDAAPRSNVIYVGSKSVPIQRIIPLKNSLIILKEDGAYKLSGNTPSSFVLLPLDLAVSFKFPNAAVLLNDSVYCLSMQGILRIGENGTMVTSYPIEDRIKNIASYSGCDRFAFAVANEENRRLIVFTQNNSGDRGAKIGWIFNYLTKEWTTWNKPVNCGASLTGNRDLYLGHTLDSYVLKERNGVSKRNSGDYMDEDIPVTVTDVSTASVDGKTVSQLTLSYSYSEPLRAGFIFTDGNRLIDGLMAPNHYSESSKVVSIVSSNDEGTVVVVNLDSNLGAMAGTIQHVSLPIDSIVKWAPDNLGVSEYPKQFTYANITMESSTALTNELGFYSDAVPVAEWVGNITLSTPTGWGSGAWGTSPWGNHESVAVVPLVSAVPRQHQRCRELTVMYRHRVAGEEFNIESIALRYKLYKGKLVRTPA